jgi:DNA-binding response OmpR family regulator
MKVLVVEEIAGQQSAVCESLRQQDYSVERVCGGRDAILRATRQSFDLIVLDLMLPSEPSLLVLHEIRELNKECEILILSNPEQIRERVTALIQGADDYLLKPFKPEDLYARILSLAKRRNSAHSIHRDTNNGHSKAVQLNRLIENLSQQCHDDNPGIELVFSEIKLAPLLVGVLSCLDEPATHKVINLQFPGFGLPTILSDARGMEHLLVNLLSHTISQSLAKDQIDLDFQANEQLGEIIIESSPSGANCSDDLESIGPLSLARYCARCLNLRMRVVIPEQDRLQIRISNIRII